MLPLASPQSIAAMAVRTAAAASRNARGQIREGVASELALDLLVSAGAVSEEDRRAAKTRRDRKLLLARHKEAFGTIDAMLRDPEAALRKAAAALAERRAREDTEAEAARTEKDRQAAEARLAADTAAAAERRRADEAAAARRDAQDAAARRVREAEDRFREDRLAERARAAAAIEARNQGLAAAMLEAGDALLRVASAVMSRLGPKDQVVVRGARVAIEAVRTRLMPRQSEWRKRPGEREPRERYIGE